MQTAEINSIETTLRELAPLVTDVQRTLEAGLEQDGAGTESVAAVIQPLTTIRGTLELIELHGAATLVREMGELAAAVSSGRTAETERALETLLEAVLRLPDYLDRVRAGQPDTPTVLLPLINGLRALRGESSLDRRALFFPAIPSFDAAGAAEPELQAAAQRLRGRFQRALLGWYRGAGAEPLIEMGAVLQEVAQSSRNAAAQQLWEVAGAFVDLLAEGGDEVEDVKPLMARLERLLSALARDGEAALAREAPGELLRNLLFHIAHSGSGRASVQAVRQAYRLDRFVAGANGGADFEGLNRELLDAVGEGIRSDLAQVKDAVEIYVHSDVRRPEVLEGLPDRLKQVAETFSMLGLADDHAALKAEAEALAGLDRLSPDQADERLQMLADELLRVEAHMAQLQSGRAQPTAAETREQGPLGVRVLPDSEYQPLVAAVVTAALEGLSKVREAIGVYCSDGAADRDALGEVPGLLSEIEGAAWLLPLERAATLLRDLRDYVDRNLMANGGRPDDDAQVLIADVVAGLEYYLEAVAHDRAGMTHLLEGAVRAMEALRSGGNRPIYDEDEEVVIEAPAGTPGEAGTGEDWAATYGLGDGADAATGGADDAGEVGDLDVLDFQDFANDPSAPLGEAEQGPTTADAPGHDPGLPSVELGFEFDEFGAQTADADGTGAAGAPEALDSEALSDLDVSLDDLNACGENAAGADDAPATGKPTFPDLDLELEPDVGTDAAPEPSDEAPEPQAPAPSADTQDERSDTGPAPVGVDPAASGSRFAIVGEDVDEDVVEVYIEEALGELDKINECLPRWKGNTADEDAVIVIRRAYHTLKGGGRLIGAELLGEFSWAMESLLNRVIDRSVAPSEAIFDTLDEASAALPQLIEQIQGNRAPIEGIDDLITRAHVLSRGEPPPPGGGREAEDPASPSEGVPGPSVGAAAVRAPASGPTPTPTPTPTPESEPGPGTESASTAESLPAIHEHDHASGPRADTAAAPPPDDFGSEPGDGTGSPDRTLLEIFSREARTHQQVLHGALGAVDDPAVELPVSADVDRAVHTLVGSSQTAGVEPVANLAGEMEDVVRARREHGRPLHPEEVTLFREAIAAIDRVLDDLPEIGRVDVDDVRERLRTRSRQVVESLHAGEDESDSELLNVFLGEADELLEQCDRAVAAWRDEPDARTPIGELQRGLHTLKGGARMANLMPIGDLTHELEAVINAFDAAGTTPDDAALELMQETVDALTILLEQARAQQPIARVDWLVADLQLVQDQAEGAPGGGPRRPASVDHAAERTAPRAPVTDQAPDDAGDRRSEPSVADAPNASSPPTGATTQGTDSGPAREPGSGREPEPGLEVPREDGARADDAGAATASDEDPGEGGIATEAAAPQPASEQVRVQSRVLDNLVNFAGEVSIYHSRLNEQMGQYRFNLGEFEQTVSRLRAQLRTMEDETESQILFRNQSLADGEGGFGDPQGDFDPLEFDRYTRLQELSRSLSESIGDLDSLKDIMDTVTRDAETLLLQQARVSSELQDGLMQTRMVRFDGLRGRLARIVRQTAAQLGKKVHLTLSGGELELDRSVQERIVAPLEHALRNAVAHGIEPAAERERLGKPAQGSIQLDLHRGGTDVVIEITDDGRGIDPAAVRRRAVERGLIGPDDTRDDGEIIKLILETGFSTADEVTQIAGRGVGMDVVDAEIRRLGGTLGINTEVGGGTRFTIRLPVTLAINQAVLVETGDDVYAIPIASVEGVAQVTAGDLKPHYVDPTQPYMYAGAGYRLEHLGRLLGTAEPRLDAPEISYPVIMIRAGDDRIALHVEQLVGRRDIVVKPLGTPLNELSGLSGATIMPDGRVVLILDVGGLLRTESRFVATGHGQEAGSKATTPQQAGATAPTVLVVDDSITIRKVTQRILERYEFHVVTAKDGIDALAWMAHSVPDLILLDIEMPRMDGYEVATYVRGEERLQQVPIIMITSRTGEKHRTRAETIGVDRYLGKPYQETELMEHIGELIHVPATA